MKRKLWLTIGAATAAISPVAALVACEKNEKVSATKKFTIAPDAVVFDISSLDTENVINGILGTIGTKMPKSVTELDPKTESAYEDMKVYLSQANFAREKIRLVNGGESFDLDFSKVHKNMDELSQIANTKKFSELPSNGDASKIGLAAKNIQPIDYTKAMLDFSGAMAIADWLRLYIPKPTTKQTVTVTQAMLDAYPYGLLSPTGQWAKLGDSWEEDVEESSADIALRHPYINLLRSYHEIFYNFFKSDFYKKWVVGKTFIVAKNDSAYEPVTGTFTGAPNQIIVNPGELYDIPNSLGTLPETSNFEFSFFYSLLGLK